MNKKIKQKLQAFGLVEALIGIAIFGTLIVTATSVTIRSLGIVKDNEIADFATGLMIDSLEFAKYDAKTISLGGSTNKYYSVKGNMNDDLLEYDDIVHTEKITEDDCKLNTYQEQIKNDNNTPICNQIIIEKPNDSNHQFVTSRVIYKTAQHWYIIEAKGVRINEYAQ